VNTFESTEPKADVIAEDPIVELASKGLVVDDRERLRIIHELTKHIWIDNSKRNFNLLRKIHEYSRNRDNSSA